MDLKYYNLGCFFIPLDLSLEDLQLTFKEAIPILITQNQYTQSKLVIAYHYQFLPPLNGYLIIHNWVKSPGFDNSVHIKFIPTEKRFKLPQTMIL